MRKFLPLLWAALCHSTIISPAANAYSNFIGYGYSSCLNCHFNASGGGPLKDYGRALAASEISGRLFGGDDESLAADSGFLGATKLPMWWRPSLGYRGLYASQTMIQSQQNLYITMQGTMTNVIRFDAKDKIIVMADFGYAPTPQEAPKGDPSANKNWISREYYVKVELSKFSRIYAGFMDKIYGLRVPDHESFARKQTYNGENDQTHGIAFHYAKLPIEIGVNGFVGNLLQDPDIRQKGGGGTVEYEVAEKARVGLSAMFLQDNYVTVKEGGLISRLGVGTGSSIILENGLIDTTPLATGIDKLGFYSFTQSLLRVDRGFHLLTTLEYYTDNIRANSSRSMRFGPGIQYFPIQRLECRVDTTNVRSFDPDNVKRDDWSIFSQVHLWF